MRTAVLGWTTLTLILLSAAAPSKPLTHHDERSHLDLSPVDSLQILGEHDLARRVTTTTCHSHILQLVQQAALRTELPPDEGERSGVAISFTLCAMASALQTLPDECTPWITEGHRKKWFSSLDQSDLQRARCLGALHRSPQDWTTYNAYLSDATQLWSVLTTRRQTDLAQELYANATRQKIALLRYMQDREGERVLADLGRGQAMDERLEALRLVSSVATDAVDEIKSNLKRQSGVADQLQEAIEGLYAKQAGVWDKLLREVVLVQSEVVRGTREDLATAQDATLRDISVAISSALDEYSRSFTHLTGQYDRSLSQLETVQGSFDTLQAQYLNQLTTLEISGEQVQARMDGLASSLGALSRSADELVPKLNSASATADNLTHVHSQLALSLQQTMILTHNLSANIAKSLRLNSGTLGLPTFNILPSLQWLSSYHPGYGFAAWTALHWTLWLISNLVKMLIFGWYTIISTFISIWCLVRSGIWHYVKRRSSTMLADLQVRQLQAKSVAKTEASDSPHYKPPYHSIKHHTYTELKRKADASRRRAFSEELG